LSDVYFSVIWYKLQFPISLVAFLIQLLIQSTAESLCNKIGAFDHLEDFAGHSYTASEFEELPALQRTLALQRMTLFTRYG
jgi:hypothetical protein